MKKPELLVAIGPSGDPLLRGACSLCLNVTFVFTGNTEENYKLMQQAFDKHFREVHLREDASKPLPGS
jgi:hypothetical protein